MRYLRSACRALLTAVVATTLVTAATAVPALAVSPQPRKAPLFNGPVYAIAYRGSTAYVGGSFTSVAWGGRSYPRARLAAFDTATGTLLPWAPAANSLVRSIAIVDADVYVGGNFTKISGERRDNLAQLNAESGAVAAFAHQVTGTPYALTVGGAGRLYVAGSFSAVDGLTRRNLAAFVVADGSLDMQWAPRADDTVHSLAANDRRVYVGGAFHQVNGVNGTLRLAAVTATGGSVVKAFLPKAPAQVNDIDISSSGVVYAGVGGQGGRAIAYSVLGERRWQRVFDGDVTAVASLDGKVYVGGHFDRACATERNGSQGACADGSVSRVKLAAVSRTGALAGWAPQANGVIGVRALAVDHAVNALGAVGDFTTVGGQNRKRYAWFS